MVEDNAPYGYDELKDWCLNNPLEAANLIIRFREDIDAQDNEDFWQNSSY